MKRKRTFIILQIKKGICVLLCVMLLFAPVSCTRPDRPDPQNPVRLTIWHTYVEQMGDAFHSLVDEFNNTVGAQQGIVIEVGSVSNSSELNERLLDAAEGMPGAVALPDIMLAYPQIAVLLAEKGLLADLGAYFSEAEFSLFVPQFLNEGKLGGETQYLLPVAKSTEVLYLNRTLFDRFSAATGADRSKLSTFEGIIALSAQYYEWTDAATPDILNDGKAFYYPNDNFNFTMVGFAQLGKDFLSGERLNLQDPLFEKIWGSYFRPAVVGGVAIFDKFGNYIAMTGDTVCYTNTSAGAIYYPDSVTYADNTKEDVVFEVLPYPVFEGGKKIAVQRGAGMCVLAAEAKREYAAALFLKWLTEPRQNLRMTSSMGYLPVTIEAFEQMRQMGDALSDNEKIQKMLMTAIAMQDAYEFYIPPVFHTYDALADAYNESVYELMKHDRTRYLEYIRFNESPESAWNRASGDAQSRLRRNLGQ
ncbi:extracellular solute-binding protein [Christensenellaceae bacterium OttesenSCG-928-M15]|nr:extracellular solute-binding protein [Christensenellaceae bacterium OttesenSCG-928-M15]